MIQIFKYIVSLIFLLLSAGLLKAQKSDIFPSKIQLGADLSLMGLSVVNPDRNQFEFNANVDFYRFFITADYGLAHWSFLNDGYNYDNKGNYYRAGFEYNFLHDDPLENIIFMGFKFNKNNFTESFNYDVVDTIYDYNYNKLSSAEFTGNWLELNAGVRVRVWKNLYMGWTGRFKFLKNVKSSGSSFMNYWVPGYGKSSNDSAWGISYSIYYRIPFRKKKIIPVDPLPETSMNY